jgi:cold-inducible RNA-binding protein
MGFRLYVGNIAHDTSAETLRAMFSQFGEVTDVQVVVDRYSGRPRGFAFVTMAKSEEAAKAVAKGDGTLLDGRPLRVSDARVQRVGDGGANQTQR